MPRRLLLQLDPDFSAACADPWAALRWARPDDAGAPQGRGLPGPATADSTILLLPAEWLLLLPAPELPGSRAQRERAAAFAVEDQLMAPVESQQVVLSTDRPGQSGLIAVVDAERLASTLQALSAQGIEIDAALPESALLPAESAPCLLIDPFRAWLRWPDGRAFAGQHDELQQLLKLPAQRGLRPRIVASHAIADSLQQWLQQAGLDTASVVETVDDARVWLRGQLDAAQAAAPDLLQGRFQARHRNRDLHVPLRWAAMLACAALLLTLLYGWMDQRALRSRLDADQQAMQAEYRRLVPDAGDVFDPVNQLRSKLASQGSGSDDALWLLARVAPVLAEADVLPLFALDYRDGQLDLTLRAASVAALDQVRLKLAEKGGLDAELVSVTPGQNGTEGHLRLRAGSGG